MKICRVCNIELSLSNSTYYRLRNYIYLCNDCNREKKRKWASQLYQKNPKGQARKCLEWQHKNAVLNPIQHKCNQMYGSSKKRARIMELTHNINAKYLITIAPAFCPVLKFEIDYFSKSKNKNSPSLDRINPSEGYVIGNVQIISYLANLMKSNASKDELINFANWILSIT